MLQQPGGLGAPLAVNKYIPAVQHSSFWQPLLDSLSLCSHDFVCMPSMDTYLLAFHYGNIIGVNDGSSLALLVETNHDGKLRTESH